MNDLSIPLILASASERRSKILAEMGLAFRVVIPLVDEIHEIDQPESNVRENARRKNAWCRERYPDSAIIAADTVVDLSGHCIPKPRTAAEAREFLRLFSGRVHKVHTATAFSAPGSAIEISLVTSEVCFRELSADLIEKYIGLVNPLDKAGGYNIDQHGELIVSWYRGSLTNIMGLPRETVQEWLNKYSGK